MEENNNSFSGLVFDIKRFSVNDGPGIRTTLFFKGCPLRCLWCHNPESYLCRPQMIFDERRCIFGKHDCLTFCPRDAIRRNGHLTIDLEKCDTCGKCADQCPAEAIQTAGRWLTPLEAANEIARDTIFFDGSGGGVTFSGGEPLMQPRFLKEVLSICRKRSIHTAVDTSGFASADVVASMIPFADLWLYDLKVLDDESHIRLTGVSNQGIIANLRLLTDEKKEVIVRIPLIPGYTDNDDNVDAILLLLQSFSRRLPVSLLPFHKGGDRKFAKLGLQYELSHLQPPSLPSIERIRDTFKKKGFSVTIGE